MEKQKFYIEDELPFNVVRVWLIEERLGKQYVIGYDSPSRLLTLQPLAEGSAIDKETLLPLFVLPRYMAMDLFKHIATHIKDFNIVLENESVTKGKLVATEAHLKDMQKITTKLLNNI